MRIESADPDVPKGWYLGPWNSNMPISIGYANEGIDEPHEHTHISEVYLVARGTCEVRIEDRTVTLRTGDMLVLEPGEAHTFLSNSDDYFHFVLHVPGLQGDAARTEKRSVQRSRLGL